MEEKVIQHDIHHDHEGSSMGFVLLAVFLIFVLFLFVYFLLPAIRQGGTQINIPDKIDVNVNQGK